LLRGLATPLWRWGGPAAALPLILPIGVLAYKLTIVLHDCAHMTLFRTRRYNRLVGRFVGFVLGTDFAQFQAQHFLHHRAFGQAIDPQGRDYLGLQHASRREVAWHLLRPLIGYNLFKLLAFQPPQAGDEAERRRRTPVSRRLGFLAGTAAVQGGIVLLATQGGAVWWNALLYPVAAATVALFLSQLRGFCEHVTPVPAEDEAFVRTHAPNLLDRLLFYGLNFNYHVEHHLYPAVPSCRLPALYQTYGERFHNRQTLSSGIVATLRSRLAQCPN
jgi:fatty acid desaturase